MKRILLAATGSPGDLHPMLAIGLGLKQRGHSAIIAKAAAEAARRVRAEDAVRAACDAIEECAEGKRVLMSRDRKGVVPVSARERRRFLAVAALYASLDSARCR